MSYSGTHTLGDVIRAHATRAPDAPALIGPQNPPLTYGQFASEMDSVRATLNGWTIGRGDRVALIVASHAEAIVAYVCVAAAATVVPLTPDLTEVELDSALRRSGAKAVIASEGLEQVCDAARKLDLPLIRLAPKPTVGTGAFHLSSGIPGVATLPGPAAPDDIATVLMSSGTTAEPKLIPLTHALVVHRAEVERDYFQLSQRDVCINFRQPYLAGSLHGGLIPALVGGGIFVVPGNFDPDGLLNGLAEFGVTWFTCGAAHLDALLARAPLHQDAIKGSRLRFIRVAGSHLPGKLLEKVEATFDVICVEAYATTECGTISCTPMPPAQRKPGTVGLPSGSDVAILGDRGERLPAGEDGEIAVRGPKVFAGYDRNDAARTATVLSDGWFRTGDLGRLDEDGHLTICGRVSDVINRGGQKVSPPEVERALLSHDDVRDCICFPVAHPTLNQVVAAAVVLRPKAIFDEAALRNFLRHPLSQFKIPVRIVRWDEIPRGASGKPLRAKASEMFARLYPPPSQQAALPAHAPGKKLEWWLAALWCEILELKNIDEDENFFMLGGDSLRAIRLLADVEEVCGLKLPFDVLFNEGATVAGMAKIIDASRLHPGPSDGRPAMPADEIASTRPKDFDEVLRRLQLTVNNWPGVNVGDRVPIFILNPQGKLPPIFWCFNDTHEPTQMAQGLGLEQPIYAMRSLHFVISDKRQRERFTDALARLYVDEILRLPRTGPYFVGGNCEAGGVAEAVAHLLMGQGRSVAQLSCLEYEPQAPFPGRVALFFGAESVRHNPFLKRTAPEQTWKRLHKEVVWDIIPGDHGQYFQTPNLAPFVDKLRARLAEARIQSQSSATDARPEPTLNGTDAHPALEKWLAHFWTPIRALVRRGRIVRERRHTDTG